MLKQKEVLRLKEWADKKFFQPNNLAIDIFDFEAEADRSLNFQENQTILREKLKAFLKEQPTKQEIKNEIEKQEYEKLQDIIKTEENSKRVFEKAVYELKEKPQILTDNYFIPIEYIKSVAKGFNKSFVFLGHAGIGKSYTTIQTLAKENINFVVNRGVNSPLALYQFLYENNQEDLIILFDDVAQLINNENAYSILLGVLWEGVAQWNSTTEKLKIPKQFNFKGRIIIIANKLNGFNADIIKSRCLVYEMNLNKNDILTMMYEIAKQPHEQLTQEERFKIVDFLKANTDSSTINLDLRTQQKAEQLYLYSKGKWEVLVKALLQRDNNIELLEYCFNTSKSIKEAQEEFCKESGLSRATFYRIKQSLIETGMLMKGGLS